MGFYQKPELITLPPIFNPDIIFKPSPTISFPTK